jgi:hypothetical protein
MKQMPASPDVGVDLQPASTAQHFVPEVFADSLISIDILSGFGSPT